MTSIAGGSPETVLVVPCYNEALRLDTDGIVQALRTVAGLRVLFVDDGSSDGTAVMLAALAAAAPGQVSVVSLSENRGKAEAVRVGLQHAIAATPVYVGYWDADMATPLTAVADFRCILEARRGVHLVLGSRVRLLGRAITRRPWRHYPGRVFATAASVALEMAVYDTQCGAKLLRVTPELERVVARPFQTRWLFDIELLMRHRLSLGLEPATYQRFVYECALHVWTDVPGSKVRARDAITAGVDLVRLWWTYHSLRELP